MAQMVNNPPTMQETQIWSLGQEDSPGEGNGYPLQYSCLENSMDREAWQYTAHGVSRVQHDSDWACLHEHRLLSTGSGVGFSVKNNK